MQEMNTRQTMEYLKQAVDLEVSVYKQEETSAEARRNLVRRNVPKPDLTPPKKSVTTYEDLLDMTKKGEFRNLSKKNYTEKSKEILRPLSNLSWPLISEDDEPPYLMLGMAICILIISAIIIIGGAIAGVWVLSLVIGGSCLLVSIWCCSVAQKGIAKAKTIQYNEQMVMNVFKNLEKYYEEVYQEEIASYRQRKPCLEAQYSADLTIAEQNFEKATMAVRRLDAFLEETKDLLEKLYAADVIFPKYRNMVAMCTMYEYFASGRCTELTGPNGAYNLYEQELRQNLIINQLENINANLEQVKQNQYILYQGIMETNRALQTISGDVKQLVNAAEVVAESSRITAFYSEVTAKNTQAIKYLMQMEQMEFTVQF